MPGPAIRPQVGPGLIEMSHATESYERCPYNTSHVILSYRMQTHLYKCRKNYPKDDIEICPLDVTHHIPKKEMEFHKKTCSSRRTVDSMYYGPESATPIVPVRDIYVPESSENWDDDEGRIAYDPLANAANKNLIRGIHGKPPAERKNFKLEHRRKIQSLEEEEAAKGPVKDLKPKIIQPQVSEPSELKPLRLPTGAPSALQRLGRGTTISKPIEKETDQMINVEQQMELMKVDTPGVSQPTWMGMGRGKIVESDPFPPLPPGSAWGRGRPKF